MPRPTIFDVAARCGVSKASVSKALSRRPDACDLAAATKERILRAATELGYAPDAQARAQSRRRFHRIGLLYGTRVPIFFSLFEGFADALGDEFAKRGYDLIFLSAVSGIQDWERASRELRIDGLIVNDPVPPHLAQIITAAGMPVVVVNHHIDLPVTRLIPDEVGGVRLLVDHLADLGHRRICYYQSEHQSGHPSLVDRLHGYRLAMNARGLEHDIVRAPLAHAAERFRATAAPSAVIAYNCADGVGLAEHLSGAGVVIPGQLSLGCFEDVDATRRWGLTAVHIPRDQMGRRAAALLIERVEGRADEVIEELVPVSLVVRTSTAPPRQSHVVA